MSFREKLRELKQRPKTVVHRVLLNKGKGPGVHVFFEGHDEESFLSNFIEPRIPSGVALFRYTCGGKEGVLNARAELSTLVQGEDNRWFFVDRDYDDFLGRAHPDDVYVTRYYSIENEMVSEPVVVRYLRDLMGVDDHEIETLVIDRFREALEGLHAATATLSAWIIEARLAGQRLRLSDGSLASLVTLSEELEVTRRRGPANRSVFAEKVGGSTAGTWRDVRARRTQLRDEYHPKQYLRGKYELWFMVHFLLKLPALLNQGGSDGPQYRTKRGFGVGTAVESLGPRTPEPPCLAQYLDSRAAALSV